MIEQEPLSADYTDLTDLEWKSKNSPTEGHDMRLAKR